MKYFNYTLNGKTLRIKLDRNKETIADIQYDGQTVMPTAEEMPFYAAAISLALLEYDVEVVHDEEPGFITLSHGTSPWGEPVGLIPLNTEPNTICNDSFPTGEVF